MSVESLQGDLLVLLQQVMQDLREYKEVSKSLHEVMQSVLNERIESASQSGNLSELSFSSSSGTSSKSGLAKAAKKNNTTPVKYAAIDSYNKELTENNLRWTKKKEDDLVKYLEGTENLVAACEKKCPRLNQMRYYIFVFLFSLLK